LPSFPCNNVANDASGNSSCKRNKCISSGYNLHVFNIPDIYFSGSLINLLAAFSLENTHYLSFYLNTPSDGFPDNNKPLLSTSEYKQNP